MRHLLCFLLISYFILSNNKVHIGVAKKSGNVYRIETIGGKNEHSKGEVRSQTEEYGTNYEDDALAPYEEPCGWDNWNEWSAVSQTCGRSSRFRNRSCRCGAVEGPSDKCGSGQKKDKQVVKQVQCNSAQKQPITRRCTVGGWSTWSQCSKTCWVCTLNRNRVCTDGLKICDSSEYTGIDKFEESKIIELDNCCFWGNWGEWSGLSKTCGSTSRTRNRSCKCGHASGRAKQCGDGDASEYEYVDQDECCIWNNWGEWTGIEKTCGSSIRTRIRDCICGTVADFAEKCDPGHGNDLQVVKQEPCTTTTYKPEETCAWDTWGEWSGISHSCGSSSRTRQRLCTCGAAEKCGGGQTTDLQEIKQAPCTTLSTTPPVKYEDYNMPHPYSLPWRKRKKH